MSQRERSNRSAKTATWTVVGILVFATLGVIILGITQGPSPSSATQLNAVAPAITATDWTKGNKDAKVTVIEYGDFQCPACGTYEPIMQRLESEYGDRVLFVFRNFPLYQIHDDAGIAAQSAEAAGLQGKYWEMHDLIYEKQGTWSLIPFGIGAKQYFAGLASSLGLDVNKFNADIESVVVKDKIQKDVDGANAASVDHTPTFFVNLKVIKNPAGYDEFKSIIDQALASS